MTTIRDLAKKANVSITTVSKILNNDPHFKVKDETRELVISIAKELKYKSKSKVSINNNYIAVIQWYTHEKELEDTFYLNIRNNIEESLNNIQYNYDVIFANDDTHNNMLSKYNGIICIGKYSTKEIAKYRKITNNIVLVDMELSHIIVSSIVLDFKNAMYDALNFLLSKGHNSIGFLAGNEYTSDNILITDPRKKYFLFLAKSLNINYKNYVVDGNFTIESGYEMMSKLINTNKLPSAIICASDSIAIGAIKAIKQHKLRIPEDISIIGFNNDKDSIKCDPPLTTIHVPTSKMGQYSVITLKNIMDKLYTCPVKLELPCELLLRKTTN